MIQIPLRRVVLVLWNHSHDRQATFAGVPIVRELDSVHPPLVYLVIASVLTQDF